MPQLFCRRSAWLGRRPSFVATAQIDAAISLATREPSLSMSSVYLKFFLCEFDITFSHGLRSQILVKRPLLRSCVETDEN
jgi:hypothetical protein